MDIEELASVADRLKESISWEEKISVLDRSVPDLKSVPGLSKKEEYILKSLIVIGQEEILQGLEEIKPLLASLFPVEAFYASFGGLVGYQVQVMRLLARQEEKSFVINNYEPPQGIDISADTPQIDAYVDKGLESLPFLGEIYVVGGAADRLRPHDPLTLDPLPAASFSFCGYTLLEWLIRDIEARESLYYERFGEKVVTPIALMTSYEKRNHENIVALCEEKRWFGRGQDSFRFFCQPLVPTMDAQGKWCVTSAGELLMKPGGHGVLWKLAEEAKIFEWMRSQNRSKLLVRQINNPIAGIDHGLLAFCGVGFAQDKAFGFASCSRQVHSAEGMNVLIKGEKGSCLTNIEYCDFSKKGICDVPMEEGGQYSRYPSNTNILFADIDAVQEKIKECPLPGTLVNKKSVATQEGEICVVRLESTMQNLADAFVFDGPLATAPTFLTYHERHKTISAIKKRWQEGADLLETPEGCLQDWIKNTRELLSDYCGMQVPQTFFFFYHGALGPLFSRIALKIRGGKLGDRAEVRLELAHVEMQQVEVEGSLHVEAVSLLEGSCILKNVRIVNKGLSLKGAHEYWKGECLPDEVCKIRLGKNSHFYAEGVVLEGNQIIEVREGEKVVLLP
ncbi:MAG: hypothetical protein RLZZ453_669 [Chlamydiota bacterium]|jgi:hypothetical protein